MRDRVRRVVIPRGENTCFNGDDFGDIPSGELHIHEMQSYGIASYISI